MGATLTIISSFKLDFPLCHLKQPLYLLLTLVKETVVQV